MSTRKLILAALVCGLAILVAGGAMLARLARGDAGSTVAPATVGATQEVGTTDATVESVAVDDGVLTLTVRVVGGEGGIEDLRAAWSVLAPRGLVPRAAPRGGECTGPVSFGEDARCTVSFAVGDDAATGLTAFFRAGDRSASWELDAG
jgi:hypothetical protein